MKLHCPNCGRALKPHCSNTACTWFVCGPCAKFGDEDNWLNMDIEESRS